MDSIATLADTLRIILEEWVKHIDPITKKISNVGFQGKTLRSFCSFKVL